MMLRVRVLHNQNKLNDELRCPEARFPHQGSATENVPSCATKAVFSGMLISASYQTLGVDQKKAVLLVLLTYDPLGCVEWLQR